MVYINYFQNLIDLIKIIFQLNSCDLIHIRAIHTGYTFDTYYKT